MKQLITLLFLFGIFLNSYTQKIDALPVGSSIASGDIFVFVQSGTTKQLQWVYIGNVLNDTADVLRAELPPLWRDDIADTADVLRLEIADAVTADTAWTQINDYVVLKHIDDSVGIGTVTPAEKLEVNGRVKAIAGLYDNGFANVLLGNENTGINLNAGGTQNIFIGNDVGKVATAPDYSVGIGYQALFNLTTGSRNVGIGRLSGYSLSSGEENILIGQSTGFNLTTGDDNVFIGDDAGEATSTSTFSSVYIGSLAGNAATGGNNIYIGYQSGLLSTGSQDVHIGGLAGQASTSNGSTLVGYRSGQVATSSDGFTAVGYQAGLSVTTSDYHTVMGYQALDALQTSDGSSVFGYQAGSAATASQGLTAVGNLTLTVLTTGDFNSGFGAEALKALTIGGTNTAAGALTGITIVDGDANSMFGTSALGNAGSSVSGVTAIGRLSGFNNTGDSCVFLGLRAGLDNTADNVLFIDNANDTQPAIWGDLLNDRIVIDGNSTDNTNNRTFFSNGSAGGTTVWNNDSDRKLKKDIEPITDALDIITGLQGVRFKWKDGREPGDRIGFIANNVYKVLPEVVTPGETFSMQYGPIVALLTEAIKEQQEQIESQQRQIDRLIKEVNKLK